MLSWNGAPDIKISHVSYLLGVAAAVLASCAKRPPAPVPDPIAEPAFGIVVENQTVQQVTVFIFEPRRSTRLGRVAAGATELVPVANHHMPEPTSLRLYLFRGPEPCPVPRLVNFRVSPRPRITVTATDTVVSAYLPGDACRGGVR